MSADIITRMFEVIDSRDWERLGAHFAADAIYHRPGYDPIRGLNELDHFYRHVRIIAEGKHAIDHIVLSNDIAACSGSFHGSTRDGRPLQERFADVYQLERGLIRVRTTYFYRAAI